MDRTQRVQLIDDLLPQTQCRRCGYDGCRPYAEAIADGDANINRCPPGGDTTLHALAKLLDRPVPTPDTDCGEFGAQKTVWIDPHSCIGCARCLPPCPVDAIIGASRQLHVVLDAECTGCELCIAHCPIDCIVLMDRNERPSPTVAPAREENLQRFQAHERRVVQRNERRQQLLAERKKRAASLIA